MAVQQRWLALGCAVLIIGLTGCSGAGANLVGKWKGKVDTSKSADSKDPGAAFGNAMANALGSMMSVEFKADKTFTMTMMMFPIEGNYSVSGDTVTLNPTKVMGMSPDQMKAANKDSGGMKVDSNAMDKPMKMKISSDGKRLTAINDKPGQPELTFEKESG